MDQPSMPNAPTVESGRPTIWIGLLILYVVWGSTYLGIAIAIDTIPPFLMAATRFLIAGSVLVAWSVAREGRSIALPSAREWRDSAIVGALLLGGGMGIVAAVALIVTARGRMRSPVGPVIVEPATPTNPSPAVPAATR